MSTLLTIDATVEDALHLRLEKPLEFPAGTKARVVFLPDDETVANDISEAEWLKLASRAGGFDDWNDPREDIYTLEDGTPLEAGS
jgi:hypothetical protein